MTKQEYIKWLNEMESKGFDQNEIESIVEDYLQEETNDQVYNETE